MKEIRLIIEKNDDGYWSYAEGNEAITGYGETVQECKEDVLNCIETLKTITGPHQFKIKEGEYKLVFKFDTESLLNYYKGIFTNVAFAKITGINQRQIQHYSTGLKKPRPQKRKQIEAALHELGRELISVEL